MIEIQLTKGYVAIVDDEDADLAQYKWHEHGGYAERSTGRKHAQIKLIMHRVIMERSGGRSLSKKEVIDHIDGNGLNNKRSNLRVCSIKQNIWNMKGHSNTRSGLKGVYEIESSNRKSWYAQICVSRKRIYLGSFFTKEEAHEAYKTAAVKYFGEFARFE